MKVYVSELPIGAIEFGCDNCPYAEIQGINHYFINNEFVSYRDCVCKLDKNCGFKQGEKLCPLQSLVDYTKQVRKEVCEDIKYLAEDYFDVHYCEVCGETAYNDIILGGKDLTEILDQIQGETK